MSQRCYECGRETPSYTSPLQHFDGCVHEPRAQSGRLSTPANMVTVPASELRAMRERHQALLNGIEGLEREMREWTYADLDQWADDLKALREKANGSQGERGSS